MNAREHWNSVYDSNGPSDVSWHQPEPTASLSLIQSFAPNKTAKIIDVGGGTSLLVDRLLGAGFTSITALDISSVALAASKKRLGERNNSIRWIEASILGFEPKERYDVWHDRAVFHFLTDPQDRKAYVRVLRESVPSGTVIISTFALDGPKKCSSLEVVRYNAAKIAHELGNGFRLVKTMEEKHVTPWETAQHFAYFVFSRREK